MSISVSDLSELLEIGKELDRLRREVNGVRAAIVRKAFDPNQPRVPAGTAGGGEWTKIGSDVAAAPDKALQRPAPAPAFTPIKLAARRISPAKEAACWAQLQRDFFHCDMVGIPWCKGQAMLRYGNCLAGRPIPPLSY